MDSLYDEIESLEAILLEDVIIHKNPKTNIPEMIETTVFPIVGGDTDRQYICVTLQVIPTTGYPDVSPEFRLNKPRGLDDQRLNEIKTACVEKLNESIGYPVVFDLIDVIREHLTDSNLPSGQCVICLYGFQDGDQFTKTECYHYLHSFCLSRHLLASKRNWQEEQDKLPAWLKKTAETFQPVCPVCREVIGNDVNILKEALPPSELENAPEFQLTDDLKELQMKMSNLFLLQKSRGAIIEIGENEANVLSIEPEEQRQQQIQRKNNGENDSRENGDFSNTVPNVNSNINRQNHNRSNNQNRNQQQQQSNNIACGGNASSSNSRVTVNHTNFTPIVNNTPRYTTEPTNNNYNHHQHYNRRHYRGNNRRHHHRDQRDQHSSQAQQQQEAQPQQQQQQQPDTNGSGGTNSGKNYQKSGNNHQNSSGSHKR